MFPFSAFVNNSANDTIKSDTFEIVRCVRRYRQGFFRSSIVRSQESKFLQTRIATISVAVSYSQQLSAPSGYYSPRSLT